MPRTVSKSLLGSLNLLVLKALSAGPLHGYAITTRIQQISDDVLQVEEGSLYPALHRLEQEGLVRSEWSLSETNRRVRFYQLTPKGRRELKDATDDWERTTAAIQKVLRWA
jgi:transcriptional regulator